MNRLRNNFATNPYARGALWVVVLAMGFLGPQLFGGSEVVHTTAVLIAIFAIMSYGNDIILSDLGEVSLGQTVFWATGAYVTAILVVQSRWAPLPALFVSVLVATVIAFLLGLATIRTREFVFSLVTYASAIIATAVVTNTDLFGGSDGIVGIPMLSLPVAGGSYTAYSNTDLWPICFACLVLVIAFVARFRRSRLGITSLMTHMNPDLATTMGVDTRRTRVMVFTLSAPISALAGWLYAFQRSYVSPDLLSQFFLLLMLTAVIVPGKRILLGPLLGTALLVTQQQHLSFGGDIDKIILGGLLAIVLLTSPDGLAGWARAATRRRRGTRPNTPDTPAVETTASADLTKA